MEELKAEWNMILEEMKRNNPKRGLNMQELFY